MKTRAQRKYLDRLLPDCVRAVLSCLRPTDALPLARCAKHWREAYLSNEAVWKQWYLADFGPFPWAGCPDWLEGYRWLERYRSAWSLRIEAGTRALGLAFGEDFSAYSPRATPDGGETSESDEDEFPHRGRLTVRDMGDERDSDDSSDADDSSDDALDLEYYMEVDDGERGPDPNEVNVGVYLTENNRIDCVVAYWSLGSLFDPARPWLNRAGIRRGCTLRQLLAAFRLAIHDVDCLGINWYGPLCGLDGVDGLRFVLDNEDHRGEMDVAESWLDFEIFSFYVHSSGEEDVPSSEEDLVEEDSE